MWLTLAEVQRSRLRAPGEAFASLEQALAIDPSHPVPAQEMARLLEDSDDARGLRTAIEQLAAKAKTPEDRARHLRARGGDRRAPLPRRRRSRR